MNHVHEHHYQVETVVSTVRFTPDEREFYLNLHSEQSYFPDKKRDYVTRDQKRKLIELLLPFVEVEYIDRDDMKNMEYPYSVQHMTFRALRRI